MSTRGTILDTLAAELAKISVANGYASNVRAAMRDLPYTGDKVHNDAVLTIIDSGPDRDLQICGAGKIRASATVQIVATVTGAARGTPPTSETNAIMADIRECIRKPIPLGANVRYVDLGDVPEIFIEERIGIVRFPLTINYWYDGASP
jgi:hypothetical protein